MATINLKDAYYSVRNFKKLTKPPLVMLRIQEYIVPKQIGNTVAID